MIPRLRLALAVVAVSLLAPAAGHAAVERIDSNVLDISADHLGRIQASYGGASGLFFPPSAGLTAGDEQAADAGFHIAIVEGPESGSYGPYGFEDFAGGQTPTLTGAPPNCQASGACSLQTSYGAGSLDITQTLTYDSAAPNQFVARFLVNNPTCCDIRFRAFMGGDLYPGSDSAVGQVAGASPNRTLTGLNDHFGLSNHLVELAGGDSRNRWSFFEENFVDTIESRLLNGGTLANTVNPDYIDAASAIQWDGFATNGMSAGSRFEFSVIWRFPRFPALTLGEFTEDTVTLLTGEAHTVQPTTLSGGAPLANRRVRFTRTGVNAGEGSSLTNSAGDAAPITWSSATAGQDAITVHFDRDDDTIQDPDEPVRTQTVIWQDPAPTPPPPTMTLDPGSATRTAGETHTVTAVTTGVPPGTLIRYTVTGANPGSGAVPVGADGRAAIQWVGANAGNDTLNAFADLNGNGAADGEPVAAATATWNAPPVQRRDPFPPDIPVAETIDQLPNAEPFETINVGAAGGDVSVKLPPANGSRASQNRPTGFIPLTQAAQVPVGSEVRALKGRIILESSANRTGTAMQRSQFYQGQFQILQRRARRPITEVALKGGSFRRCPRASSAGEVRASQRRGRRVRRLWGNGRGRFRTRGRYSSATVRGTNWLVEDRCNGTLTRVARRPRTSRLVVRDFARRRNITLRAGRSYFAFRRGAGKR